MSDNKQLFDMASLSEAAYADLFQNGATITTTSMVQARLVAAGWSATQAAEFLTHYRVISQQPNTASGYSATLFERLDDGGVLTGQYVFAQRGTEPTAQFGPDTFLDSDGQGSIQIDGNTLTGGSANDQLFGGDHTCYAEPCGFRHTVNTMRTIAAYPNSAEARAEVANRNFRQRTQNQGGHHA